MQESVMAVKKSDQETSRFTRAFSRDERGGVAIMFAIASLVVFGSVGAAVDTSRAYLLKSRMQSAMDAASLAGASHYVMDPQHSEEDAITQARSYFQAIMVDHPGVTANITLDPRTTTIRISATASVKTPFLSVIGIRDLVVNAATEATTQASLTSQGEVEMSLMLDVTGSMGSVLPTGQTKLKAMQDAALNFVDILIPDQGRSFAKIALAPFSQTVNAGDYAGLASGQSNSRAGGGGNEFLRRCLTERTGPDARTDAQPGAGAPVPVFAPRGRPTYLPTLADAENCAPRQSVVPLTADKSRLKSTISAFEAAGSTAGTAGTAWAWYLLSPKWATVFTGEGAPRAYGTAKLRKIAVLLTDGTYNTRGGVNFGDGSTEAVEISGSAVAICSAMKASGIEVFTVGFGLDTALARQTMTDCASSADRAFLVDDAAALEAAFRDIAHRSVPLHLSQ
jgi:Flp pilus assembly protein TadG